MFDGESAPTKALTFDVASAAIKGQRDYQEDTLIANFPVGQALGFAIIADGIGGHVAGDRASALVATKVFTHLKMQEAMLENGSLNVTFALREAVAEANAGVAAHIAQDDSTRGMGTTLLVPVIRGDRLSWISVGDSPLYLLRTGALRQLNKDHSMAPQIDLMVKTGSLSAEKGADHPDRNTLTSVVNGEPISEIDCPSNPILLKEGDILIAASDGLQALSNATLANTLMATKNMNSIDCVRALLAEVEKLEKPDQDNTTFVVIKMTMAEAPKEQVMDLDSMPVLAQAEDEAPAAEAVAVTPEPVVEPVAEPVVDERKAYFYRGQKYYRD